MVEMGCFKFSRLCGANLANLIDRQSSTHGRRPMPSALPLIFCQVHFLPQVLLPLATLDLGLRGGGRPASRSIYRTAVARRTLGQIVRLLPDVCARPRPALQLVMSSRLIVSPR